MAGGPALFHFVMIKPTHYDDDGYPIQWLRSAIPANTLAAVHGLALDCQKRQVLGSDVVLRLSAFDETNVRIRPRKIVAEIKRAGGRSLIGFIGVQSNQFPRTLDLARQFIAQGMQVAIGGFHVSGCLSMLPELPQEIRQAQGMGISIFAGESEDGGLDDVLRDAYAGTLKPLYNRMKDLPSLEGQPVPMLWRDAVRRTEGHRSSFDLGRGCPFQCSFCTIINVQGRKSRFRTADDLELIIRDNARQGVRKFFITDDNFARNKDWEALFDRLIRLRENEGLKFKLVIQVDTLCHKIPGFIEKACRAGVNRCFIGLENINPDNLMAAKKRQNKITEYRYMLQMWRRHGVTTYAGYILGFPNDTRASILRDIEIIKRELPVDLLEFFFLTPLPGSEDHLNLLKSRIWMDEDLNKYDLNHRVTHHAQMSDAEWEAVYAEAWHAYYSPEHFRTVISRAAALPDGRPRAKMRLMLWFYMMLCIERVHPLEGGVLRRKYRTDRRNGLPIESPLTFYPKYWAETVRKASRYARMFLDGYRIYRSVARNPGRAAYTDLAIAPPSAEELETLEMFSLTSGGKAAVARKHRDDDQRAKLSRAPARA
ncbi:radical SAM protein [Reyranella sp. CPCC 100927]|uniref:B12-binding domain-containing radical SAM protein n=1 Tax=Reyranella sp. CPCC 100927 TaxID=2599616 RepID=UPI002102F286|nr:radical SAM protein [Reyranella sp. CPCC 100927]